MPIRQTATRVLTSRWLLVPSAFALGALIASVATAALMARHVAHSITSDIPMQAYQQAVVAASIESGDNSEARETIRHDLRLTMYSLAMRLQTFGGDFPNQLKLLRLVATYYSRAPDPELDPTSRQLLSKYTPFSQEELAAGACNSAICRLGKSSTTRPGP